MTDPPAGPLEELAARRGIAVGYTDAFGRERRVGEATLLAVLRALGEEISAAGQAPALLAAAHASTELLPPVIVAWDGVLRPLLLRGPGSRPAATGCSGTVAAAALTLEDGTAATGGAIVTPEGRGPSSTQVVRGAAPLPFGAHRLGLFASGAQCSMPLAQCTVISAPSSSPSLGSATWGVFAPTYGLSDGRELLAGDLTCLEGAARLIGGLGGSYLATLPLLADYSSLEAPGRRPSPYSPITRMWWNEAYLDPARVPELAGRAGEPAGGPAGGAGSTARLADIAGAGARLRPLLSIGVDRVRRAGGRRLARLAQFQAARPDVLRYATFRAAAEAAGPDLARWPAAWASGTVRPGRDVAEEAVAAHVYAQWVTDEQVAAVAASSRRAGCRLLLDLPVGCRPDGYDPWAYPASFAGREAGPGGTVAVGAPPDQFFSAGQDWSFPPLHPQAERQAGYPVVRAALSHLFRHAGALRIDHAMGLRRLWWIPDGFPAAEGAYVHYPSEELVALVCLEAWRHSAAIVAEDLGTVEPEVHQLLSRHGIAGMDVAVFDLDGRPGETLHPPSGSAAFVDTHDTATFAGWLDGTDVDDRERLGLLSAGAAAAQRARRLATRDLLAERLVASGRLERSDAADPARLHAAVLEELGESAAALVMVTLEDLWAERDPQNMPGTGGEHANFCRRLAHGLSELATSPDLLDTLARLAAARARSTQVEARERDARAR